MTIFDLINPSQVQTTAAPAFTGYPNDPYGQALWGAFNDLAGNTGAQNYLAGIGLNYMSPESIQERTYNQNKMLADEQDRLMTNALSLMSAGADMGNAELQNTGLNMLMSALGQGQETGMNSETTKAQPKTYQQKAFEGFITEQQGRLANATNQKDYTSALALQQVSPEEYNKYLSMEPSGGFLGLGRKGSKMDQLRYLGALAQKYSQ